MACDCDRRRHEPLSIAHMFPRITPVCLQRILVSRVSAALGRGIVTRFHLQEIEPSISLAAVFPSSELTYTPVSFLRLCACTNTTIKEVFTLTCAVCVFILPAL